MNLSLYASAKSHLIFFHLSDLQEPQFYPPKNVPDLWAEVVKKCLPNIHQEWDILGEVIDTLKETSMESLYVQVME